MRRLLARYPRLRVEQFPGYAPDLNPDDLVWAHFKATLANGRPDTIDEPLNTLSKIKTNIRTCPSLLRSFITESELPSFF